MDHSFSRVHYPVPNPPRSPAGTRAGAARGMDNRRFAAAMAQGRRPDPFRTRKLRPGTAMVLHPEGCGRVARRRTQTSQGGDTTRAPSLFTYPGHTREHARMITTGHAGHARRIPYPRTRDTWTLGESHTRTHDTGTPGIKNRTYDPQQDCARPLLNMPASSSRSGFHVSASILWQSQSFVKPVFSILVNMRIVFCFITLEPSDLRFPPRRVALIS